MNTPARHVTLDWKQGYVFSTTDSHGNHSLIDGDSGEATSPVNTLLLAAGACSGADVVGILLKQKATIKSFQVEVSGTRREDYPKRFTELLMVFRFSGEGITRPNAERAVALSLEKYCSVVLSLNPDIVVKTEIVIE